MGSLTEGADWEANANLASTLNAGDNGGAKSQRGDYVYPGRLPEEDAAWVEWFRENDIDIENDVDLAATPSVGGRDGDPSNDAALRPE
jgi:hypothetical protein